MDINIKEQELKDQFLYFFYEQLSDASWIEKQDEIDAFISQIFESYVQEKNTLINEFTKLGLKNEKIPQVIQEYYRLMKPKVKKPQKEYDFLSQALEKLKQEGQLYGENEEILFENIVKLIEQNKERRIKIFIKQINISNQAKENILEILDQKLSPQNKQLYMEANSEIKSTNSNLIQNNVQKTTKNLSYINSKCEKDCLPEKYKPIKILQQFSEIIFGQLNVRNRVLTSNVNKLLQLIETGSCQCIGFLGDFRVAYKILSQFIPNIIPLDIENDNSDQFDQLVAYTDGFTVFIVYHDTQYYQKEDVFENNDRSLYIRNILDTCSTIVLCLNEDFVKNWSDINPFQNNQLTKIQYTDDESNGDLKVNKIETEFTMKLKESQIVQCSLDCQEIIYTWSEEDSQAIDQRQFEDSKNKIEQIINNLDFKIYQTSRFNQEQEEQLKQTIQQILQVFQNNNQWQYKIADLYDIVKKIIIQCQKQCEVSSSLETPTEIEYDDINILLEKFNFDEDKDSSQNPNDIILLTFQDICQKYSGFCKDCTKRKTNNDCQVCKDLQETLNNVLDYQNKSIDINNNKTIENFEDILIKEYNNNSKKFVQNLEQYQCPQFTSQLLDSQKYFTKQIYRFKQKIFIKKIQEDNIYQLLNQNIVEHAINTIIKQIPNKRILSKNIQSSFTLVKETILSVLQNQLNQEQKSVIFIKPLINKFLPNKNKNIIENNQNLCDVKLPKEAHSILNYFCFDSEIDYIVTCNSNSPKEDQKVTIWKISKNGKGNQKQIFENVLTISSSDVCIHINNNSKKYLIFDNINQKQAMGVIEKDYSLSQERPLINVYTTKIKDIGHTISRVDNCFILNGIDDKIYIYEKQFSQYFVISLDSDLIEFHNFQLYTTNDGEVVKVENLKIHKVFNCLQDQIYVFETDNYLQVTDQNYIIKEQIPIDRPRYKDFKIIVNISTVMVIVVNQGCQIETYIIQNGQNTFPIFNEFDIDQNLTEKQKGNPMIDNLVESIKNYGQNFVELGCPENNQLFCYYEEAQPFLQSQSLSKKITKYLKECFDDLQINYQITYSENQNFKNIEQLIEQVKTFLKNSSQPIPIDQLKLLFLTRIPIQISTIQQSNYYPLINGQLQDQVQFQRSESVLQLEDVYKKINFGWFEEVLKNIKNESLYVISIFGRQSVGKSSLLNRMFGTRFGVSVSRCTDGVWLGYTSLDNKQILVLDCEGLFSVKRSRAEELKLLQQITLISDISILLIGLEAIDKPFQDLLNELEISNKNKKAKDIYFQGSLQILVKDINGECDIDKMKNEISTSRLNLKIKTNINYLKPYLHKFFNRDLQIIRKTILANLEQKQQNAVETLTIFKLSISQLFLDDDTDIELIYQKFKIQNLTKQFKIYFLDISQLKMIDQNEYQTNFKYKNGNKQNNIFIKQNDEIECFDIEKENELANDKNIQALLCFDQRNLKLSKEEMTTNSINIILLQKIFDEKFKALQIIDHNNYYQQLQCFFDDILLNRKKSLMKYYELNLPKEEKFQEICNQQKNILDQFISEISQQIQICSKNCKECKKRCINQINHINDCNCQTNHICLNECQKCHDSHQCQFLFGHQGTHLCSTKTHFCEQTCQFPQCKKQCKLELNHSNSSAHDCKQKHMCKYNCKLFEKCRKTCNLQDGHMQEDHLCNSDKCYEKCIFCDKQCSFKRHDHSILIQDPIKNKQKLTFKYIDEQNQATEVIVDAHLCGESHQCQQLCSKEGICDISYQQEEKEWVSNELKRKFNYNFYKPQNLQQKCSILIPKWQKTHKQQIHECQKNHRCDKTCPECLSFCNKDYNHEGKHQTDTHRNKEQCIFLNKTEGNISIKDSSKQRCYEAGESAEPENCYDSCLRQGRGHFHLRECQGGDLCAQNLFPFKARHSKNKFYPYINKQYDEILCKSYWNQIGWETPLFKNKVKENQIELCNYVCSHQSHFQKNNKLNFCTQKAWHEGIHNIQKSKCEHEIIYNKKIQICFTVDTTGSMGKVFDQMKSSVENIVNSLKIQEFDIKFAIVCYRDHPEQDDSYGETGLKIFQFQNKAGVLENIQKLNAKGGGDTPENVICALYYSCKDLVWDKEALKVIIHIGDAPPHGQEYGLESSNPLWTKNGCPCGIKKESVFNQLKSKNIKYFMVKCSSILNMTEKIFKKEFGEFFRNAVDIQDFSQINQKIADFVVKEVHQSLEYYHVMQS